MVTTWEGRAALFAHSCESQDTCEKEDIAHNTRQGKKRQIKKDELQIEINTLYLGVALKRDNTQTGWL